MPNRFLVAASWIALLTVSAPALADDGPPIDAPGSCIDPIGKDGLPKALVDGPKVIGTYKLTVGKPFETKLFRLVAAAHFMPERVGSSKGEWLPGLEVQLVKEIARDG